MEEKGYMYARDGIQQHVQATAVTKHTEPDLNIVGSKGAWY